MRFQILTIYKDSYLALVILLFSPWPLISQPQFEGIIRYEISNSNEIDANLPHISDYYLKDNKLMVRVFMDSGNEMARILLDGDERIIFMIDDIQKSAIKLPVQVEKENQPGNIPDQYRDAYEKALDQQNHEAQQMKGQLKNTGELEIIAGYECIKYRLESTEPKDPSTSYIWLTEDIHFAFPDFLITGENPLFQFLGTTGFPLKLIISSNGRSTEIVAIRIENKKLKDELFFIPEDYTISDLSSLMKNR